MFSFIFNVFFFPSFSSESDKRAESFSILMFANASSEWLWNVYLNYFFPGLFAAIVVPAFVSVLMCLQVHGHFDIENISYMPFRVV